MTTGRKWSSIPLAAVTVTRHSRLQMGTKPAVKYGWMPIYAATKVSVSRHLTLVDVVFDGPNRHAENFSGLSFRNEIGWNGVTDVETTIKVVDGTCVLAIYSCYSVTSYCF